jgi:hypothetical protein
LTLSDRALMATSRRTVYQADTRASSALAVNAVGNISAALAAMVAAWASTSRPPHEIGAVASDRSGVVLSARLIALFMTRARSERGKYNRKVLGR